MQDGRTCRAVFLAQHSECCFAGVPVHGHSEPVPVYHHQHVTNQQGPAVFADPVHSLGPQTAADPTSQLPPVQDSLHSPMSQNDAVKPPSFVTQSDAVPTSDAPSGSPGASGVDAEQSEAPLANSKEKTPMCLINELSRFNKVRVCLCIWQCDIRRQRYFYDIASENSRAENKKNGR